MKLSDFDYTLPDSLISQTAISPRDAAKLLVVDHNFTDSNILSLADHLEAGDLLIFNDTKVLPSRLYCQLGNASIEVMLHKTLVDGSWLAFIKPAKKVKEGDILFLNAQEILRCDKKYDYGEVLVTPLLPEADFYALLHASGNLPLPPYIKRAKEGDPNDVMRYQTIFAKHQGAVAAPTAGLHFTERLLKYLEDAGVQIGFVTLHVGAGTFLPVREESIQDHKMHSEWYEITEETAQLVNRTKDAGKSVIAVGTTSMRVLESVANAGRVEPATGETDIFITPGYRFQIVDYLLTNFHLPKSTLLMLISAFSGFKRIKKAYQHAIRKQYRFYSYGDACLLKRMDQDASD